MSRYEEGQPVIHTNTVENYFSVLKRGMRGRYQHCKEKHLHRYLAEFDFRYNNRSALNVEDKERAKKAIAGAKGKHLTYKATDSSGPEAGSRGRAAVLSVSGSLSCFQAKTLDCADHRV